MKGYKAPFGYVKTDDGLLPIEQDLALLEEAGQWIEEGSASLRAAADYINSKASSTITHQGLKVRLEKGVYIHGGGLFG